MMSPQQKVEELLQEWHPQYLTESELSLMVFEDRKPVRVPRLRNIIQNLAAEGKVRIVQRSGQERIYWDAENT